MSKKNLIFILFVFVFGCGGGSDESLVSAVSLTADPAHVSIGGRSVVTAEATINPFTGDSIDSEKVSFVLQVNESGAELHPRSERLDGNGQVKCDYMAGGGHGVDVVEAIFSSGVRSTVTIKVGDGVVVGNITIAKVGDYALRITVYDARGIAAPNVNVALSSSSGTLNPSFGTTNSSGFLDVQMQWNGASGSATITASAGGVTKSQQITFSGGIS